MSWGKQLVMGHEGAGIVRGVGPGMSRFLPGDAVILNWAIPYGQCSQCLEGNQHFCETNE